MARPRGFDEDTAVRRATEVFWRKGYHATSTRDLGEELELNPSSLYRTFGDKHRLFLRALDHYRATESTDGCQRFRDAAPTLAALVETVTAVALGGDDRAAEPVGCFVVNTAAELGATDPEVSRRAEGSFELTRTGLADILTRMRDSGELPAGTDPAALTDLLFTLILGWRLRSRAGHSTEDIRTSVENAISLLGQR
ncbi:TetR/AcrR family transcriptional regulator [Microlunatus parietis]|uniref:TetR/AcrR family transcriptional repressor of nem operon n=1 Tax=Microlunatus parietis TaxID=682979 RepID=A0A7Y9IAZ1_9ACTN|nr:TetR/AcrR family transcriptional regulator [Microlunatus parietis]NYE73357.1 TetR/AcrR family transcriptional repressor of nem operon [Microlunatus parietis]